MKILHGIVLVALGAGVGQVLAPRAAAPAAQPARVAEASAPPRYAFAATHVVHADAPSLPVADADSASTARVDRATAIVDTATARGTWTDADREALRDAMASLPGATKAEITARLADAVNRGAVRIAAEMPL